ncbi:carbonic anhydrase [Candidatus Synechococcus calcipolaris G9]|uniref:carbonic anhydrase n=1 Tax=Candidatus Synechococcus calcipolaris G9 TaxID=1497997 RepID=A0ABT6EXR6_9SYNE|nr:carbonic anhydrase [Candidatus Synechococcus calcipolaris]MDG2990568.1 carbonic anhydrase [Candidatus Synechococcus calcipolaris G9]
MSVGWRVIEIASLEFSTAVLRTKVILVLGHGSCGAVYAALRDAPVPGTIGSLLDVIRPGIQDIHLQTEDSLEKAIKANIRYQMEQLKSSSIINSMAQDNRIKVVGAYYDLHTGVVDFI